MAVTDDITTARSLPRKEIEQLIDCIGQIEKLDLSDLDYRIQCRLPGSGQYSTHFGLPLCMALIASYSRKTIPDRNIYLGEVDLFRKVLAALETCCRVCKTRSTTEMSPRRSHFSCRQRQ